MVFPLFFAVPSDPKPLSRQLKLRGVKNPSPNTKQHTNTSFYIFASERGGKVVTYRVLFCSKKTENTKYKR